MNPINSIKEYIKTSHERCQRNGIDKNLKISKKIIKDGILQKRLDEKKELILVSEPFINQIYNFVKGSNFFAILTDEEGCILSVIGDDEILAEAFNLKMINGAYMDETNIGTNAMSIALSEGLPVQVSGKEHYIKAYHRWTCSAAPIRNKKGEIIGTLDLTGYKEKVHPHTLGMVVAAVNAIERTLIIKECSEELKISKIYTETIIDSIPSGILTADLAGNIKSVNEFATEIFGYSMKEIRTMKIWELFDGWEKVKNVIVSNNSFLDEDVFVNSKKNKLQFNLCAYPIYDHNKLLRDIVCSFKEVKKVRKLADKIMGRRAIYTFDKIIGRNENFTRIKEFSKKVADSKSTILILGESGTGKELFAQSIHNYSNRSDESFVALNCGAMPKTLIESELFGYEKGAFTGAKSSGHPGKFEIADGGTIFLDEIGEMPLDMQTRLLRVIEEGTVSRIGSTKEIVVNVRIIAATNKDLEEEVKKGNFRKDLFYRLNVLPITLPPLRERKDDLPLLIEYFMKRIAQRLNKKMVDIPNIYMEYLKNYNWPGNVRELENFIELMINTECIPINLYDKSKSKLLSTYYNPKEENQNLENVEKQHIRKVLEKYYGNITLSAKALGIGRNTLYRKIGKYNIDCSGMEQCSVMEH